MNLGEHGVVVGGDVVAGKDMGVNADAEAAGEAQGGDAACRGREVAGGVTGGQANLDGVAVPLDIALAEGEFFALCDLDLPLDEVHARHHLRDGMLDLEAGVHLHKIKMAVGGDDELDGPGAGVARRFRGLDRRVADALADAGVEVGSGGLLDHLLVALGLKGAVALAEVQDGPMLVGQNLDLNMAEGLDELLDVDVGIAEGRFGFKLGGLEDFGELFLVLDDADAAPAAAAGRLDHHREADLGRHFGGFEGIAQGGVGAGDDGDAGLFHGRAGRDLVAHKFDGADRRADVFQADGVAHLGERGDLGQKADAGVDGVAAGDDGGAEDVGRVEVGAFALRRPDADGLIGQADMERVDVGLGVDGDGRDLHFAGGADDADGDIAPGWRSGFF